MADVWRNSGCAKSYTAHYLPATSIGNMNDAGYKLCHTKYNIGLKNERRSCYRTCFTGQNESLSYTPSIILSGHLSKYQTQLHLPQWKNLRFLLSEIPVIPTTLQCRLLFLPFTKHVIWTSDSTLNNCTFQFTGQDWDAYLSSWWALCSVDTTLQHDTRSLLFTFCCVLRNKLLFWCTHFYFLRC